MHPVDRAELIAGLEVVTDPRIERYWQLTATINGWPPFPSRMLGDLWLLARASRSRVTGSIRPRSQPRTPAGSCPD